MNYLVCALLLMCFAPLSYGAPSLPGDPFRTLDLTPKDQGDAWNAQGSACANLPAIDQK
jgi:hypothetical protein